VRHLGIPLPLPPLPEQHRIVAKIDSFFAKSMRARDQLDHISRLGEKYRQSILAAALHGELTRAFRSTKNTQVSHEGPASVKNRPRRSVPETASPSEFVEQWFHPKGWKCAHLGKYLVDQEIVDVKDGNHGANHPKREEFTSGGLPFITAAQLMGNVIDYETAPRIGGQPLKRLRVGFAEPRDVILSHKGTVGRVALCDAACVLVQKLLTTDRHYLFSVRSFSAFSF
jgi:type I restriction enzyme S subunit